MIEESMMSMRVGFRYSLLVWFACVGFLFVPVANAVITPGIAGVSTYTQVTDVASSLYGWYRYEVTIEWDTSDASNSGASHMDVIIDGAIDCPDVLAAIADDEAVGAYDPANDNPYIRFEPEVNPDPYYESISGTSTSEDDPLNIALQDSKWFGYLATVDNGPNPAINALMIKYEQPLHTELDPLVEAANPSPEKMGYATFWYYSIFAPGVGQDETTVWADKVFIKAGNGNGTTAFGDITGYMPDCETAVPEPATIFLLGVGALGLLRKRRQ